MSPDNLVKVKRINALMNHAYRIFQTIDSIDQDALLAFHEENYSINHSLRWGAKACEEIIKSNDLKYKNEKNAKTKEREPDEKGDLLVDEERKFFINSYLVEVLSEDKPLEPNADLEAIHYEISEGNCSGEVFYLEGQKLTPKEAAKALEEQASDPEFFHLDEDGNEF